MKKEQKPSYFETAEYLNAKAANDEKRRRENYSGSVGDGSFADTVGLLVSIVALLILIKVW